jgi:hypothetical protein
MKKKENSMKTNKFKIIGLILALFLIFTSGLLYFASTKLNPEEIKKLAVSQTQKVFPRSVVELGKVDIGFGFNFKINLEKFRIDTLKDGNKTEMMHVDQLVVKVPLWAILTNAGVIEIKLDNPVINYHEFPEGNNWIYAMGDAKPSEEKKAIDEKSQNDAEKSGEGKNAAIGLFGKSKINVKLSDVALTYSLKDNSKGEVKVSRFLIKGLNFESPTAFELQSNAHFTMKDNSHVSFDTLAIGQFNISDLIKNGSVSSNINIKINNMMKTGLDMKFPEVVTTVDVLLKEEGELSGKILTTFESQNKISANFKMSKEVEISEISVDLFLKDLGAIAGLDKSIDLSKSKLNAKGIVKYSSDKKINANLSFGITPAMVISKDGITAAITTNGEMRGKEISGKAKIEIFEGAVVANFNGEFDPNQKFEMDKLKPFGIHVAASGMKIPEKLIRSKLWDKKTKEQIEKEEKEKKEKTEKLAKNSDKDSKVESETTPGLPPSIVTIEWNNINVGGEDFSGNGKIITGLKSLAVDNLNFKFSKGSGKLTETMTLTKNGNDSKFSFEMQNLNLSSFKAFLPPFVENFTGTFNAKVTGTATMFNSPEKLPVYDVTVVSDAKKGEIKKLNIGEFVNPMLANIPVVKDQVKDKQIKVDGNFETFSLKGHFTNYQYSLNSFDFVGLDKKVQVTGSGEIYPIAGKNLSEVEVNFIDGTGKISEILLKNTGSKILPMRLTGNGFELHPDYGHTISKLAKGAMKTKGEEKIKEVVQKNIEKILPTAAKEKVQGLLNGLFKKK